MQVAQMMMAAAFVSGLLIPQHEPVPAMTEDYLLVQNEDPVELDAYIDATGQLQLLHGTDLLVDYSDTLHATHDTHTSITVRIYDFSQSGSTWQINASHDGLTAPIDWDRGTNYAYHAFGDTGGEITVTVTATDGTTTETKKIKIYMKPNGGL